jgi:predicted metal-dependent phosphoesterase TrpH
MMVAPRRVSLLLWVVAVATGTAADRPPARPALVLGGYQVLAADFHVHSAMGSASGLTPWGLVSEASRQGLDAIAVTGHNQVLDSKVARWFAHLSGGPTVFTGEEIHAPDHHIIAIGIERTVDWRKSAVDQIDDVHRQGGVAVAAHPMRAFSLGFDEEAVRRLDGAEICHPMVYVAERFQDDFQRFADRAPLAAIGSSDFHGLGRMGMCRTYVFARENGAEAILEAIRAKRTVVYGRNGKAFGDPALVALAETRPELRVAATTDPARGWLDWVSGVSGILGLLGLVMAGPMAYSSGSSWATPIRK